MRDGEKGNLNPNMWYCCRGIHYYGTEEVSENCFSKATGTYIVAVLSTFQVGPKVFISFSFDLSVFLSF